MTNNQGVAKSRYSADINGKKHEVDLTTKDVFENHFIDIPVHIRYSYEFVPEIFTAYAFVGPVFSLGLAANSIHSNTGSTVFGGEEQKVYEIETTNVYSGKFYDKYYDATTKKIEVDKEQNDAYKMYNMFDLKLAIGLGLAVCETVDVKVGYNIGLLNRSFHKNDDYAKYSAHSNVLYFGVAYNF